MYRTVKTALFVTLLVALNVSCSRKGSEAATYSVASDMGAVYLTAETYQIVITKNPFSYEVHNAAGTKILATNPSGYADPSKASGSVLFAGATDYATFLSVMDDGKKIDGSTYEFDVLVSGGDTIAYRFALARDSFTVTLSVGKNVAEIGDSFVIATSGHWYGQGELGDQCNCITSNNPALKAQQFWPLESGGFKAERLKTQDKWNVVSPVWFTSAGVAIFVDSYEELRESFNWQHDGIFMLHIPSDQFANPDTKSFAYTVMIGDTIRDLYYRWVDTDSTNKPAWDPNHKALPMAMIENPVWTTWAQFKTQVTADKAKAYLGEIAAHDYPIGILEVDDKWQAQYGDTSFDPAKFPDPKGFTDAIHAAGAKVTVWYPPFINTESANYAEADANRYFLTNPNDHGATDLVGWWDTLYMPDAGMIDFTDPDAFSFWTSKIDAMQAATGVDGFKFDAGEAGWMNDWSVMKNSVYPNRYTDEYVRWTSRMDTYEVRCGFFAQHFGMITREMDKDSNWSLANGLRALVTQGLALSMIGYPYVLPDIVGGNEYLSTLDDELMIRWTEANAFMPMMQFSVKPWDTRFAASTNATVKKFVDIHQTLVPYIEAQLATARANGAPIMRPLFFEYPDDQNTYTIDDEYFFGPDYLVAPVVTHGAVVRDVYLPAGTYEDYLSGATFTGPQWLTNHSVPLDSLAVFRRITK